MPVVDIDSTEAVTNSDLIPAIKIKLVPILSVSNLSKSFGAATVLKDVTVHVEEGELVALCGPSGSGKSTLLRCISGLELFQQGTITVDGRITNPGQSALHSAYGEVGMVFQNFNLFRHLTALENCVLAQVRVRRLKRKAAVEVAHEWLCKVKMADHAHKYPAQLSGGQQQRVAMARTLCMRPKVMLFDEPTSALDPEMIREVVSAMAELARGGMTMICVTHEMSFAKSFANRLMFMDEGQVVSVGPAQSMLERPEHPRLQEFLSQILH